MGNSTFQKKTRTIYIGLCLIMVAFISSYVCVIYIDMGENKRTLLKILILAAVFIFVFLYLLYIAPFLSRRFKK